MGVNYIFVGLPGSGKSTIGKMFADTLGWEYLDIDTLIEKKDGHKISEIFDQKGEAYFRDIETTVINSLEFADKKVISTGGGAFQREGNRNILTSIGCVIYLYAAPETIYERIKTNTGRPLLQCVDPLEKIKLLFNERHGNYKQSHYTIDTTNLTPYNVIENLLRLLYGKNSGD